MTETANIEQQNQPGAMDGARKLERRLLVALGGGVLLAVSWIGHLLGSHTLISQIPAAIGAIILVIPLLAGAWIEIKKRKTRKRFARFAGSCRRTFG